MKVLVLGAGGMLGASLVPALAVGGAQVMTHSRNGPGTYTADLTDALQTRSLLELSQAEVVIHLAGLTDVDRCEQYPQEAWLANVRTVENTAAACKTLGAHLLHISTDQVYDRDPPSAEDQAKPGNCYALTKYAGELAALNVGATVLRTNFFGASRHPTRRSLTDWLWAALTSQQNIQVFDDVQFSPLSMCTLCELTHALALQRPTGVFNLGSRHGLSKADFAFEFANALNLTHPCMTRASVRQHSLKAWRPTDMRMDTTKIEQTLGHAMPNLTDEIQLAAKDYRANT